MARYMRKKDSYHRDRIIARAAAMRSAGLRISKSRIAREEQVSLRYVFMVLPRLSI